MDTLVIGIDGGDLNVFEKFQMPFLENLIKENSTITLEEDLISRGWAQTISGKTAESNRSLYIFPKFDGTYKPNLSYTFKDIRELGNQKSFIWDFALDKKQRVGIMNIPTTYPAPKNIDGFFVSGAGGGLYSVEGVPKEMCNNDEIHNILDNEGYLVELRFVPSGIKDIKLFLIKMREMMEKRTDVYIKLAEKENIDFGFMVYRASANVMYLAMSEILQAGEGGPKRDLWWQLIKEHFTSLDQQLKKLFDTLNPNNFILTSDHGMAPAKYHVNYNNLLCANGFLKKKYSKQDIVKAFKFLAKTFLAPQKPIMPSLGEIDFPSSMAFSLGYSNAIYINDASRFNGPVKDSNVVISNICDLFKNDKECNKHNITAKPFKELYAGGEHEKFLPDLIIDCPDSYVNFNLNSGFIKKNPWYGSIKSLDGIHTSMFTGTKGKNPLCIMNNELAAYVKETDPMNLTLVFKLIQRHYQETA